MVDFDYYRSMLLETTDFWGDKVNDNDICEFYHYLEDRDDPIFHLYRYRPCNYHNLIDLEYQNLFLASNSSFNDAFEGATRHWDENAYAKYKKYLDEIAYIACLSESNDNLVMWGNYADSFKGFCVEYDIKRLVLSNDDVKKHLFPVIYDVQRPFEHNLENIGEDAKELIKSHEGSYFPDDNGNLDDILPMFISKGEDWSYEREWRIIYTLRQRYIDDTGDFLPQKISFPYVSSVYLGYRIDKDIRQDILDRVKRMNTRFDTKIKVYDSAFAEKEYKLCFNLIDMC